MASNLNSGAKILIVDDVPTNLGVLKEALEPEGHKIIFAPDGLTALELVKRVLPDLILLDVTMPGIGGFETCRRLKEDEQIADIPVIFLTARTEAQDIMEGFECGAVDYVLKPFQVGEVVKRVETHLTIRRLSNDLKAHNDRLTAANDRLRAEIAKREEAENAARDADQKLNSIRKEEADRWAVSGMIGNSASLKRIVKDIQSVQPTPKTSVLVVGESGTGKELVARAIHFGGVRSQQPFVPVNCSAIPRDLSESLFFGHVRGAFSGAAANQIGYFEMANGGTLFLDEIGDMPRELQAKFLRVLEDGRIRRVGAREEMQVDVRVLAATNADLESRVRDKEFRQDLYFRLAGFQITVPPLRERKGDIELLAEHFLALFSKEMGKSKPRLSDVALSILRDYAFPGNVRELKHIVERALIECAGNELLPEHLHLSSLTKPEPLQSSTVNSIFEELPINLEQAEALVIQKALAKTGGNVSEAAKLLKTNRMRIYRVINAQD